MISQVIPSKLCKLPFWLRQNHISSWFKLCGQLIYFLLQLFVSSRNIIQFCFNGIKSQTNGLVDVEQDLLSNKDNETFIFVQFFDDVNSYPSFLLHKHPPPQTPPHPENELSF